MSVNERIKAIILLSGGIDSAVMLAKAQKEHRNCYCLSINYGQRHIQELEAAKQIAQKYGAIDHVITSVDMRKFGGSALTSDEIDVSKSRDINGSRSYVNTYVPARNLVFLGLATAWAETIHASEIWIGVNADDHADYPDCRRSFIAKYQSFLLEIREPHGLVVRVCAPFILCNKTQVISWGASLGVDYSLTHTCYDPTDTGLACGRCDACQLRLQAFGKTKLIDPIEYVF